MFIERCLTGCFAIVLCLSSASGAAAQATTDYLGFSSVLTFERTVRQITTKDMADQRPSTGVVFHATRQTNGIWDTNNQGWHIVCSVTDPKVLTQVTALRAGAKVRVTGAIAMTTSDYSISLTDCKFE